MGQLRYPRTCWRITLSYLPNHKSWEVDEVKQQLGKKMAAYFFQGAAGAALAAGPAAGFAAVLAAEPFFASLPSSLRNPLASFLAGYPSLAGTAITLTCSSPPTMSSGPAPANALPIECRIALMWPCATAN